MGKKRVEYEVSPREFIEAWQTSGSSDEVAEKLAMPKAIVLARASKYRAAGVNLKQLRQRGRPGLDVAGLNQLIDELAQGDPPRETHVGKSKK